MSRSARQTRAPSSWQRSPCRSSPRRSGSRFRPRWSSSVTLIVVDAIELPFWPQSIATRHADTELESDRAQIKEFVSQAAGLGVEVEHLRVRSPRPAEAVIQIAAERRAGLLVFGPDPSRFRPRFFSRVVRRIRKRSSCLLWIAGEGP